VSGLSGFTDPSVVGIPHEPLLCEVGYAKRHINISIPAPIPSAMQITFFRLAITLILSPVGAVRFVRFVRFYGSQCGGHSTRTMFKAVLCEVGYAKWHIYISIPAPIPSAMQITFFRLAITLILSPVGAVRFVRFYGSQ
jgi:hypothetical protein